VPPLLKRVLRWLAALLVLALLVAAGVLAYLLSHPSLGAYARLELRSPPGAGVRATFLGTATLLFDDGETAFMTDGFFSRPSVWRVLFADVAPDPARIDAALARAHVQRLAAVITLHSHVDHALDAPAVALRTGALLVGSSSTANIGRGGGVPEERLRVVHGGETLQLGKFTVTVVRSQHAPHAVAPGEITAPLRPPASAFAYKEGGSFALLVAHEGDPRTILVQGSAGFEPGALAGHHAEVAFLATGGLGKQPPDRRERYWQETVRAVGARRALLVHWDDFMRPLDAPLVPMPRALDDFVAGTESVLGFGRRDHVDVRLPPLGVAFDPFAD
jgi:L-ascorbate metabolism protein UlaG (beta-lactamase superfamily)